MIKRWKQAIEGIMVVEKRMKSEKKLCHCPNHVLEDESSLQASEVGLD
jgi:hypothetical protein